jgi:hypothetical protein
MANEFVIKNGFISKGDSIVEGSFSATTYLNLPKDIFVTGVITFNVSFGGYWE